MQAKTSQVTTFEAPADRASMSAHLDVTFDELGVLAGGHALRLAGDRGGVAGHDVARRGRRRPVQLQALSYGSGTTDPNLDVIVDKAADGSATPPSLAGIPAMRTHAQQPVSCTASRSLAGDR